MHIMRKTIIELHAMLKLHEQSLPKNNAPSLYSIRPVYEGDIKRELKVSCYTDAGYLTDADDIKSQTGYVFVLNGGAVDWKSAKQSIFATSSAEAKYITAFDASK
nr:putative retrotransposon protein [Tanacetum cinerariifolium]